MIFKRINTPGVLSWFIGAFKAVLLQHQQFFYLYSETLKRKFLLQKLKTKKSVYAVTN